ncbi:MAG: tRNA preQ1(34) S-adenosylmethionine ribosyltransferase-isomerase QueA, partial [Planctomycetes bacterium]|nr:tRNA preQ1(34) S-adenosylmethionine ribosyltransferase-isomerase QueA [Planctomycetota bacterium]
MSNLTSDYDYELPPDRIAQRPAPERDASRLLVLPRRDGEISHRVFRDLPEVLLPGDLLVANDAAVVPARLLGRRASGGKVALLVVRSLPSGRAEVLLRSGRRPKLGEELALESGSEGPVPARVDRDLGDGRWVLALGGGWTLDRMLADRGRAPLPPYIHRPDQPEAPDPLRAEDLSRYQTVYARVPGAIAAPTAGLHFTAAVLSRLAAKSIEVAFLTLQVGEGTFRPITAERIDRHDVLPEEYEIPESTARAATRALAEGRRIIAVGTTACRALETATEGGAVRAGRGLTRLFIREPHEFRAARGLLTNFHLPRSSLLVLVAAFAGRERVLSAYREAVREGYRFYSYGDAMLI